MSAREEFETGLDLFATADDAGALFGVSGESGSGIGQGSILFDVGQLDKFATSYYQAGAAMQKEKDAKICDGIASTLYEMSSSNTAETGAEDCAEAIRSQT